MMNGAFDRPGTCLVRSVEDSRESEAGARTTGRATGFVASHGHDATLRSFRHQARRPIHD